jgi:hypothetical protein
VFISYRREDSAPYAGRLCDRLSALFGRESVFMDVEDIRPGQDFAQAIRKTIAQCHVLIAVIGPRWLETIKQREQAQEDFVASEIVEALRSKLTIIPVLVDGAKIPDQQDLPESLKPLSRFQAVEIRDSRFDDDFNQLAKVLGAVPGLVMEGPASKTVVPARPATRWKWMAVGLIAAAAVILGVFLLNRPHVPDLNGGWTAEMQKRGQPPYKIHLDLVISRGTLTGTVDYPTGRGVIGEGVINGTSMTFLTIHTPQFESTPATIHFQGEVLGSTIQLTSVDDNGVARGVAQRVPPSSAH